MKQIIILIAILTLLSCSKANDTKKEPEQIRYYKERMMRSGIV